MIKLGRGGKNVANRRTGQNPVVACDRLPQTAPVTLWIFAMNFRNAGLTLWLAVLTSAPALAHDTWLIPNRFAVPTESRVQLDLTSGMSFPALAAAIKPDRVDRAGCRLSAQRFAIADLSPEAKSLRLHASMPGLGIATCWVALKPRTIELTPRQVQEYLHEIGAADSVRQQWNKAAQPKRWREAYTKEAKTFLRVDAPRPDNSWAEPVGLALEIVPEKDPTTFHAGDTLPVRVLKTGKPLPMFPLGIVHEGKSRGLIRKTDSQGRVTFRLDRAGRWLLRGTELRSAPQADGDWESTFTTMTINVKSK